MMKNNYENSDLVNSENSHETHEFRTVYGPKINVDYFNDEPSKTKQSFMAECDINNILKRYQETGILPDMIAREPMYGDFSSELSYHDAQNVIRKAHEQFEALPASIREKFDNDPAKFLKYAENPQNIKEMQQMGVYPKDPEPQPEPKKEPAKPVPEPSSVKKKGQTQLPLQEPTDD